MLKIQFNGAAAEAEAGDTLAGFLRKHNIAPENLIVEWNEQVLSAQSELAAQPLADGDRIALYSMVGGG